MVIDVNTGKYSGKNLADTIRLINLRPQRDRASASSAQPSGIIMVDFIDMDAQEDKTLLMDTLRAAVRPTRLRQPSLT